MGSRRRGERGLQVMRSSEVDRGTEGGRSQFKRGVEAREGGYRRGCQQSQG